MNMTGDKLELIVFVDMNRALRVGGYKAVFAACRAVTDGEDGVCVISSVIILAEQCRAR